LASHPLTLLSIKKRRSRERTIVERINEKRIIAFFNEDEKRLVDTPTPTFTGRPEVEGSIATQ